MDGKQILADGHGSTRAITNSSGAVASTFSYDTFGGAIGFNLATAGTVYLFGGDAVYDPASGLYLHGDGTRGRSGFCFIEADTLGNGNNSDPISLHKYLYANGNPISVDDPGGHEGLADLVVSLGIALNIANLSTHVISGLNHFAHGQTNAGNQDFAWAAVDLLTLGLPFSGPGAALGEEAIQTAVTLSRAGLNAAAIWGYLTTIMQVANSAGGGGGSSSSGGSSSGGSGSSGQWENENQSGWSDRAKAYQSQINGRPGQVYNLNGVDFDGFDGTNLLDAKGPGYSNFLDQNGNWQSWFKDTGVQDLIKEADRQIAASGGRPVVWHVAEQDAATAMQKLVGSKGIQVVYTPAQ